MAHYRIDLLDNQAYRLVPTESGRASLQSSAGIDVPLRRKAWEQPGTWFNQDVGLAKRIADGGIPVVRGDDDYEHTTQRFLEAGVASDGSFLLRTGNMVGAVRTNVGDGDTIRIGSRFGDGFLRHIVADADGFVPLKDAGGADRGPDGYRWLLAYLWSSRLRRAFRLGLPKAYRTARARLPVVRGEVDPAAAEIAETTGAWPCTYRELSRRSKAAELISEAYRIVRAQKDCAPFCKSVHPVCQQFLQASEGVRPPRRELLGVPPFSNAYYAEYNDVISLSKAVLRFWGGDLSGDASADAILFDVSMLFEFFVRNLLRRNGFRLVDKRSGIRFVPTCPLSGDYRRRLIPDLVFDVPGGIAVFDVKYKAYDAAFGVDREDLFQLHTYAGQLGNGRPVKACGFVYPVLESRWRGLRPGSPERCVLVSDELRQQGLPIPFAVAFVVVPDPAPEGGVANDSDFESRFGAWKSRFAEQLRGVCGVDAGRMP